MTIDVFGWLRRKACEAVLGGVADAAKQLAPGDDPPADLDGLRQLLARTDVRALAAKDEPAENTKGEAEPGATRRKGR